MSSIEKRAFRIGVSMVQRGENDLLGLLVAVRQFSCDSNAVPSLELSPFLGEHSGFCSLDGD
jgi:hypothetical protein